MCLICICPNPVFLNSFPTVQGNISITVGGGLLVSFEGTLTNCIVWHNFIEIVTEITISSLVSKDLWTRVKTEEGTKLPDGQKAFNQRPGLRSWWRVVTLPLGVATVAWLCSSRQCAWYSSNYFIFKKVKKQAHATKDGGDEMCTCR